MSRRAKLLIIALFLVLLGIPVVYLFLSWNPENPFRFQVVSVTPTPPAPGIPEEPFVVEFTVTNISRVPLALHAARLWPPRSLRRGYLVESFLPVRIPAGGTVHLKKSAESLRGAIEDPSSQMVRYVCTSQVRDTASEVSSRLFVHCPQKYWKFIPTMESTVWETPLQHPPAPAQRPALRP